MSTLNIDAIRNAPGKMLVLGSHRANVQAVLDFDYMSGKDAPSIVGIVTSAAKYQKYFWGGGEVLIPCFSTLAKAHRVFENVDWMLNMNSGRRAYQTTCDFFGIYPKARGGHIFAEDVPEIHAISLFNKFSQTKAIVGPAGVGMLVPRAIKLGAIGGVDWHQIEKNNLTTIGSVAVLSASGGMINEIITMVAQSGHALSFALCFGGDRFPTTRPVDAFIAAERDEKTKSIVYYGELGGHDEYELARLIEKKKITKPVIAYIAGIIGESFDQPIQFGHAKALAGNLAETASAKREALANVGVEVASSMEKFSSLIKKIPKDTIESDVDYDLLENRSSTLFTSTISSERNEGYAFAGTLLQDWASTGSIPLQITTGLLGRRPRSKVTLRFIEKVFLLSIDHGPQVSGAVNTNIAARAGKGLVDSLAAGLLTIGPRFGGAVSDAAREWFEGVQRSRDPVLYVEEVSRNKSYIGGIGHKKYRLGLPDPRVAVLTAFVDQLQEHPYYDYARSIEMVTSAKKGSLILNVDGIIAALMLDILVTEERCSVEDIDELISVDFFNALFVIPRMVGFISHYLDQRRLDEGLFRLPDDDVLLIP